MKQSSNAKSRTGANDMTDSLQDVVAEVNAALGQAFADDPASAVRAHSAMMPIVMRLSALAAPVVSDADRRDAERYRWLREFGPTAPGIAPCAYHFRNDSSLPHPISGEALDVAIDAALSPGRSGEVDRG